MKRNVFVSLSACKERRRSQATSLCICTAWLLLSTDGHSQSNTVEVWMRAFIPDSQHAGEASSYIVPMPSGTGSMVRLLKWGGSVANAVDYCFITDERGFDAAGGSSRLETKFSIHVDQKTKSGSIVPSTGRSTVGQTSQVNCATGTAMSSLHGALNRDHIGEPAYADGTLQVIGQVEATNMLNPIGKLGPAIDYNFDLQWTPSTSLLSVSATYGAFPAFEVYARQPGASWTLALTAPPSATPWQLIGDTFGINSSHDVKKTVVKGMRGAWESSPEPRFSIAVGGTSAKWTERSTTGATLIREVPLTEVAEGTFRIERENDEEVLSFLGFQPALRAEIIAKSPKPSFLLLSLKDSKVQAEWNGITVIKDDKAHLKEIQQPGIRPAKVFTLISKD